MSVADTHRQDVQSIYLMGELQSMNNQPPTPATAFIASSPFATGIVPRGDCTTVDVVFTQH